jgi:hypothetical protein
MEQWSDYAKGVLSAGFIAALSYAFVRVYNATHRGRREVRGDEVNVLNGVIDRQAKELAEEREGRAEDRKVADRTLGGCNTQISKLRDQLTSCQIDREVLRVQVKVAACRAGVSQTELDSIRVRVENGGDGRHKLGPAS